MKLYSRKNLILGLVCCLLVIFEYKHFDSEKSVVWMAFFGYMAIRNIHTAFNAEASAKEEASMEREKRVLAQLGPFWRFPAMVILAPTLLGAAAFGLMWPSRWGNGALFLGLMGSVALGIRFRMRYNELMEREKHNDEETKS